MKVLKVIFLLFLLIVFGLGLGVGLRFLETDKKTSSFDFKNATTSLDKMVVDDFLKNINPSDSYKQQEEVDKFSLFFVGDIMLDRGVRNKVETLGKNDYLFPFSRIVNFLKTADMVVGNLEGPISNKGKEVGNLYSFRMSPAALKGLKSANFKVLFLANNHIGDWGLEALKDSIDNLKKAEIVAVGVGYDQKEAYEPKIVELKNLRLAFLAFADFEDQYRNTEVENNIALTYLVKISEAIKAAKEKADIVIVYYHFGEEYEKEPNPRQEFLAELAIDEGADLVVGSHPHVTQPLMVYKDKYIAYSLGNFVFDQNFSEETMKGVLLMVNIENKNIVSVDLKEFKINSDFQPVIE